jgi:predicted nucleic acid-binding protein
MDEKYLLDSNVIIGYLAGKIPVPGLNSISEIIDATPHISVISQIELLRYSDTPERDKTLADFVNISVVHALSDVVVQQTIALCKQSKIKLPDAIIAATALTEDFILVTRNVDDFKNIVGIKLLNPWDIT